ncbi:MAG: sugar ABC transporter permease [Armatimonadetes bacterium]|nr:sugar ABC transporter permease [Armatimonadota bacterium]
MPRTTTGRLARAEARWGYAFILMPFVGLALFLVGPLVASGVLSLHDYPLLGTPRWIGAQNYRQLFLDDTFRAALRNTAIFLLGIPAGMALSLALAVALNQGVRGTVLFRACYFLPTVTSVVAVSLLWMWLYNPEFGLANALLQSVGLPGPAWLQDRFWVYPALILMGIWGGVGISLLLYLAALQAVPRSLLEAATLDGAGPWQRFRHVVWPLLTPTTFFIAVMSVIGTLQMFGQIYLMTHGGPDNATVTVMYYLWQQAFMLNRMGYACAIAWVLGGIIAAATVAQFRLGRRWVCYADA